MQRPFFKPILLFNQMKKILLAVPIFILLAANIPTQDPQTEAELGEKLFFDPILSLDSTISCASCHIPEFAFADTVKFSKGVGDKIGDRNTPSSMNMAARAHFFFDGRAMTLQEQVVQPIHNPVEMALEVGDAVQRLKNSPYNQWFNTIYEADIDSTLLGNALAAFVFTLESPGDAAFDKWINGDSSAMSESQMRGHKIFMEKGKCFDCHFSPDFTGDEFRNIGLFTGEEGFSDLGRYKITGDSSDLGKMKVPGLRNIEITAPYMHNGAFATLEEVVDYYDNPSQFIQNSINIDTLLQKPLGLSSTDKADLVNFLRALTDEKFKQ